MARIGFALGHHSEVYSDVEELAAHPPSDGVVIARDDIATGGVPRALHLMAASGIWLPIIGVDVDPTTKRTVAAIKAGALDYLALPLDPEKFRLTLDRLQEEARELGQARRRMIEARGRISALSNREREVLNWLAEGSSNKIIARELAISPRTVEIHRANMMNKLGASHAADAVRLKIEAQMESHQPIRAPMPEPA